MHPVVPLAAAFASKNHDTKEKILHTGQTCALKYQDLLKLVYQVIQKPTYEGKCQLAILANMIGKITSSTVNGIEVNKGSNSTEDLIVTAETELLDAAHSIDVAARMLANLKPRHSIRETDDNDSIDEIILKTAKSVANASSTLMKAASAAQRELLLSGKIGTYSPNMYEDGQWSEGLVSAARLVVASTQSLVESANSLIQGHATEEKLISSAKQVASSTAQLLVACKVKADPESHAMKSLQSAGNAVKQATDCLVKTTKQSLGENREHSVVINKRVVGGITQEIVAREEIIKKERELEEARERLAALHRAKYGNKSPDEYRGFSPL